MSTFKGLTQVGVRFGRRAGVMYRKNESWVTLLWRWRFHRGCVECGPLVITW